MGRGRQKAKQQRIARKLKYLTTDTDYDALAQELAHQDEEEPSAADPFASVEESAAETSQESSVADEASSEELDEYAQWAAEAAKKAEESKPVAAKPVHRPFPMPKPGAPIKKAAPKPAAGAVGESAESQAKTSE
ncbi:MAG: DUF3073 domain-containing protein [Bifidobacteriaceae bacterium]|nr:DUF3073 domain-containing protein [Bifidobacteriaceae bacterium]